MEHFHCAIERLSLAVCKVQRKYRWPLPINKVTGGQTDTRLASLCIEGIYRMLKKSLALELPKLMKVLTWLKLIKGLRNHNIWLWHMMPIYALKALKNECGHMKLQFYFVITEAMLFVVGTLSLLWVFMFLFWRKTCRCFLSYRSPTGVFVRNVI